MEGQDGGILRNRRFLALWGGNAFSLVGTAGVRVAYPLFALALFHAPEIAGWIAFAATLPALILQVPAGILTDHVNRRQLLLAAQAIGLAATGSVLLAATMDVRGAVVVLVVAAAFEGAAFAVFNVAEVGAVRDVVDERHRTVAFSFLEAEQPVALLAGRAVGGALFGLARWAPFLVNALSYVFCLVTLAAMPKRLFDPRPGTGEQSRRLGDGLAWMWRIPFLRLTTLVTGFTNVLFQCVILLVLAGDRPAWTTGAILASAGAGGLLGSLLAPRLDRLASPRALFLGCVWAWTLLLFLVALGDNAIVLAVAWGGVGAVGTVNAVAQTVARVQAVPDAALGRLVSATMLVTEGAFPIGALAGGYLLATAGPRATAWATLLAMASAAIVTTRWLRPATPVKGRRT